LAVFARIKNREFLKGDNGYKGENPIRKKVLKRTLGYYYRQRLNATVEIQCFAGFCREAKKNPK